MKATRGYYCLIQYCPDESRVEAANIGVVLFCPEWRYLETKTSDGNDRVRRFFGSRSFDPHRLNDAKHAIENRLRIERDTMRTPEDLSRFVETRANGVLLTLPRPVKVLNPAEELESLFVSLVGGRQPQHTHPRSQLGKRLKAIFDRPALRDKILRDQEVTVPVAETVLKAPYAFQNGKLNLIYPLSITTRTLTHAKELALEGDLLRKHGHRMEHPSALWIALAQPTDLDGGRERAKAEALFRDYEVPVYREERLDELGQTVEAEIHG